MNIDLKLVENSIKGDTKALYNLIKEVQPTIKTMLFYLKKDENELNDLTQDVLIKLSKKIYQLKNPMFFKTWLNQITINSYYDYLRRTKRTAPVLKSLKEENEFSPEIADTRENPQENILKKCLYPFL